MWITKVTGTGVVNRCVLYVAEKIADAFKNYTINSTLKIRTKIERNATGRFFRLYSTLPSSTHASHGVYAEYHDARTTIVIARAVCKVLSCRRRNFKTKWNETPPTARHVANILKFRAAHAGEAVGVKRDRVCTSRARGTIEHGGGRRFKRGETIGRNEVVCYSKQTSNSPRNIVDAPKHVYEKKFNIVGESSNVLEYS